MMYRLYILLLLISSSNVFCQVNSKGVDDLFKDAREAAFSGNRNQARNICKDILQKSPGYVDAAILIGRTFAWDGKYDTARIVLKDALEKNPAYYDALLAITDLELWSDSYKSALEYAERALKNDPNDEDFLFRKAKAQNNMGNKKDAVETLNKILTINPGNKEAINYLQGIKDENKLNKITANYSYDFFNPYFSEWHLASFQYGRKTKIGTVIGRLNYGYRFGSNGWQGEIDAYPGLWKGAYLYLNFGYSESSIFPNTRAGIELYHKMPKAFEASIGMRYLNFNPTEIYIYTGSVGKYWGNYWISARAYITPDSSGISNSYNLTIRRYFLTADDYLGVTFGYGYTPDDHQFLAPDLQSYYLKTGKISMDYQKRIFTNYIFSIGAAYYNEEYYPTLYRDHFNLNTGISYLF